MTRISHVALAGDSEVGELPHRSDLRVCRHGWRARERARCSRRVTERHVTASPGHVTESPGHVTESPGHVTASLRQLCLCNYDNTHTPPCAKCAAHRSESRRDVTDAL
eukprot:2820449-Rhodomonas_salina.2